MNKVSNLSKTTIDENTCLCGNKDFEKHSVYVDHFAVSITYNYNVCTKCKTMKFMGSEKR